MTLLPDPFPPFRRLQGHLDTLLADLEPGEWERPIPHSDWRVRDAVAHLLDGDLRRLSFQRDGRTPPPPDRPIRSHDDLVAFLDDLNARWLAAAERLSPRLLRELSAWSGPRVVALFESLDPDGDALFPVGWAGQERSTHRFDVARELTEKWIHQQQIRDATGRPGPEDREILHAVVATLLHGVPWSLRHLDEPAGTAVAIHLEGPAAGRWRVVRTEEDWRLEAATGDAEGGEAAATLTLDADTAWRLLATRKHKETHRQRVEIIGDGRLAEAVLGTVAVMA